MANERKNTFLGGTAVLMVGVILVKVIGAVYKIPLLNILGDVGYGHFSAAYVIFNLLLTISTAGLPVALSKSIAEATALGRRNQAAKTFWVAFWAFLLMGLAGFLIMYFGAAPLAVWQNDTGAEAAIRALAPCVLFVCAMSAFRGYAQGHGNMTPTSVSQVIEALLKLIVGLTLAAYVVSLPFESESLRLESGAAAAIVGVSSGALVAFLYLVLWFLFSRRRTPPSSDTPDRASSILLQLLKTAVPITLGSSAVAIVSLVDTNLVLGRLQDGLGMAQETAVGLYGTYQGCMTLYNLPSSFMVPFTAAVIPAISSARTHGDDLRAGKVAESALRISALIALPMGIGLCALSSPIIALLYPELDVAVAGPIMAVLGISSIFVCVMLICNAILQAHGYIYAPILTTVAGALVKLILNYVLVGSPRIHIHGASISTLACYAVVALLDVVVTLRATPVPPSFTRAFAKPLAASLLMGGAAWGLCGLASRVAGPRMGCLAGVAGGCAVYLALVLLLKVFSKDDLALMPQGDKIAKLLRIR